MKLQHFTVLNHCLNEGIYLGCLLLWKMRKRLSLNYCSVYSLPEHLCYSAQTYSVDRSEFSSCFGWSEHWSPGNFLWTAAHPNTEVFICRMQNFTTAWVDMVCLHLCCHDLIPMICFPALEPMDRMILEYIIPGTSISWGGSKCTEMAMACDSLLFLLHHPPFPFNFLLSFKWVV